MAHTATLTTDGKRLADALITHFVLVEHEGEYESHLMVDASDLNAAAATLFAARDGEGVGLREAESGIYIASETAHAAKGRGFRADEVPIISTWIDEAGVGETACFTDLWRRCVAEAAGARALVVYREPGEVPKGSFVEVGAALAAGKPVFSVGCGEFSFVHHVGVTQCENVYDAITGACAALARPQPEAKGPVAAGVREAGAGQHTPTPWRLSDTDAGVILADDHSVDSDYPFAVAFCEPCVPLNGGSDRGQFNAAHIVLAVNNYDHLRRNLNHLSDALEGIRISWNGPDHERDNDYAELAKVVGALSNLASTTPPAEAKTPDAGVGGAQFAQALRAADWSNVSIGNKALISAAIAALTPTGSAGEDDTGVREALVADVLHYIQSSEDGLSRVPRQLLCRIEDVLRSGAAPQPPKAETPAGVGDVEGAERIDRRPIKEFLKDRAEASSRDSNALPLGDNCRSFYAGQAAAYENALSFVLRAAALSTAPAARPGDEVETDKDRLDWLEQAARKSRSGISFDHIPSVEGERSGFRFMRKFFIGDARDTLRSAIDAARGEVEQIQRRELAAAPAADGGRA